MGQWLTLHACNAGDPGLNPVQGTRSHMPQLRVCMPNKQKESCLPQLKVPQAATKIQHSQIKRTIKKMVSNHLKKKKKKIQALQRFTKDTKKKKKKKQ